MGDNSDWVTYKGHEKYLDVSKNLFGDAYIADGEKTSLDFDFQTKRSTIQGHKHA